MRVRFYPSKHGFDWPEGKHDPSTLIDVHPDPFEDSAVRLTIYSAHGSEHVWTIPNSVVLPFIEALATAAQGITRDYEVEK